ncbi:MAG TPA: GNAT family N-acetyltransferase [Chloroflexota bacterium]
MAQAIKAWFEQSHLDMGYLVEHGRFGFYRSSPYLPGWINVTIRDVGPDSLGAFIADLRETYPEKTARILVDVPALDADLGPALVSAGCLPTGVNIYLAHRGPIARPLESAQLSIEPVLPTNLAEFVEAEHRAFAGEEPPPSEDNLAQEMALRGAEMAGSGRFALARWDDEPAGVVGWYDVPDRWIFLLGTRPAYRQRGIATASLTHVLEDAGAAGCRSVIINVDPDDPAANLYRSLGFTEQVYWQRAYLLPIDLLGKG